MKRTAATRAPSTVAEYPTAAAFLPARWTVRSLREAARNCRGCPLYLRATRTVFDEGPVKASLMLIGETPGDQEDKVGRPFVGPAGELLDDALQAARLDRSKTYVTNAVKHFKWEPRGKRRLHAKPSAREIAACRPWLDAEIEVVKPQIVVCLGATAAQALLGRAFRITEGNYSAVNSAMGYCRRIILPLFYVHRLPRTARACAPS